MRGALALHIAALGMFAGAAPPLPRPARQIANPPGPMPGISPHGPRRLREPKTSEDLLRLAAAEAKRARKKHAKGTHKGPKADNAGDNAGEAGA